MRCPFISVYLGVKLCPFIWNTKVPCNDRITSSCTSAANLDYRYDVCGEQLVIFNNILC